MADQNGILAILVKIGKPVSLDAVSLEAPVGSPARKQVIKALGRLIGRGLVKAVPSAKTFPKTHGGYVATEAGCRFVESGRKVEEHVLDYPAVTRPKNGAKANGEAFRAALWKTFRYSKKATLAELIEVAGSHGVVKVDALASAWMKALIRAGVAVELKTRARGFAPTSNGFKRYALVRDLGPKAPSIAADFLLDNNTGERLPFDTPARSEEVA